VLDVPVAGRFLKTTRQGHDERARAVAKTARAAVAPLRMDERDAVTAALRQLRALPPPERGLAAQRRIAIGIVRDIYADASPKERARQVTDIMTKLRVGLTRGRPDHYTDTLLNVRTTAERVALLRAAQAEMGSRFTSWLAKARRDRVISQEVIEAFRRKGAQ
jgi:hypothetical protein